MQIKWADFKSALETLQKFNVLLILDYVDDEMWALEETFGWKEARKQVGFFV